MYRKPPLALALLALGAFLVVGALAPACSGDAGCTERTCPDGCCGVDGVCRPMSPTSCGLLGTRCEDCTARRLGCFEGECRTYLQECLPLESHCSLDSVCCSGVCSRGLCSLARCRSGGGACDDPGQCCSGICLNERCTQSSCGGAGNPCGAVEPCCSPLLCGADGLCVPPCKGAGAPCGGDAECCTQICQAGQCTGDQGCVQQGQACAVQGDCCVNLYCIGSYCQP